MDDPDEINPAEEIEAPADASSISLDDLPTETVSPLLALVEEYRSIQAEISPLEKRKKKLMDEKISPLLGPLPADRVLDYHGRPLTRREYRVTESIDATKLLEAGVPMRVIDACKVRKVSVYYKVP